MQRLFSVIFLFAGLLAATTASAQQSGGQPANDGLDFDTLAACSIVYGRIGELYAERGDAAQATSFASTATAYSASAYHMLGYVFADQDPAYTYSQDRMALIVEDLNHSIATHPSGEMGVIGDWLAYCDTLGDGVTRILARREEAGW